MANATVVQLGSASFGAPATTFEQEFSEARGRGRARRQKRKMERIKRRDERRQAKQSMRDERRDKRRSRREESRTRRNEARLARRQRRAEARSQRRDTKAEGELGRERRATEQEAELESLYPEDEGGEEEGGYDEEGGYAEEGGYEEGGYDEGGEEGGYDEGGEEGGYDEGYEFDGDNYEFFSDSEGETPFDYADGSGVQIAPYVQDVANRIEWNKELCCRLRDKAAAGQISPDAANAEIQKSTQRIAELQSCMDAWCNMEGEFMSDADGNVQFKKGGLGRRKSLQDKFKRKERIQALKAALQKAKNDRKRVGMKGLMGKRKGLKNNVTNVEMGLAPKFGNNKIVIPAKVSNADGTGIIGLDDANDMDSPYTEVKLGANGENSGKTTKIPYKPILIGLGVGAVIGLAVYFFRKK